MRFSLRSGVLPLIDKTRKPGLPRRRRAVLKVPEHAGQTRPVVTRLKRRPAQASAAPRAGDISEAELTGSMHRPGRSGRRRFHQAIRSTIPSTTASTVMIGTFVFEGSPLKPSVIRVSDKAGADAVDADLSGA